MHLCVCVRVRVHGGKITNEEVGRPLPTSSFQGSISR